MSSLQYPQPAVNRLDHLEKAAIAAAEERIDADKGWELMRQMDARHFEQGYIAGQIGLTPAKASLWSPAHNAGYQAARAGASPIFVNLGGIPAMLRQEVHA
ncbi:MAG: hypothetical protein KAX65_16180 [Caldilineaceae bacterium]|nr:hypothetical protein [Caldilineaceae bacterium]